MRLGFLEADRLHRQARRRLRRDVGDEEYVAGVKEGQHQPGNEGALVHVADRAAELVGHHDEHDRGRNDLRERAGCRDDAGGHAPVIAITQHDRQRNQSHRYHGRRDHAGGRRQQGADEHHRIGKAAAHGAEQLPDRVEQILGHARSFENQAHECEKWNGEQRLVAHHAIDAIRQSLQEVGRELPELDADQPEDQSDGGEREGRWIAQQQEDHQGAEHDRRHVVDEECFHAKPRAPRLRTFLSCSVTTSFPSPRSLPEPRLRASSSGSHAGPGSGLASPRCV